MNTTVNVSGMTCEHCIASVREELGEVQGVQEVNVDLHADGVSTVQIESDRELGPAEISDAIEEAGYRVV